MGSINPQFKLIRILINILVIVQNIYQVIIGCDPGASWPYSAPRKHKPIRNGQTSGCCLCVFVAAKVFDGLQVKPLERQQEILRLFELNRLYLTVMYLMLKEAHLLRDRVTF